ncbi:MAG: hypothetical protein P8R54_01405 [Myxococcota bacterium]|nr:hypothetical protein [Myxococcota bacterium]
MNLSVLMLSAAFAQEGDSSTWDLLDIPGQVQPDDPYWELELLYHQHRYQEGLTRTKALRAESPEDVELAWHQIRFMFEVAERLDRTDTSMDKEAWYQEMATLAEAALAQDPDHAHLLFGKGVALGRLGTTRGVLASLGMAAPIEQSWTQCMQSEHRYRSIAGEEMLPCDCAHALGMFYRLVPDSWIVDLIAGTRGSLEKSLEMQLWANSCKPDDISIEKELGVSQLCLGQKTSNNQMITDGRTNLLHLGSLPVRTPSDTTDQDHARKLLLEPGLACEYSRDGQQDLDEEKLKEQAP